MGLVRPLVFALCVIGVAVASAGAGRAAPHPPQCFGQQPTITAERSDRVVRGTGGDDVIIAIGRSKRIYGRAGADRICTGKGRDRVDSGPGDDLVNTGDASDVLDGGDGSDRLQAGDGDDTFRAGPTIGPSGHGVDIMVGGDGTDLADFSAVEGPLTAKLLPPDFAYTASFHWTVPLVENLIGTEQADDVTGSDGPDEITLLGGDDRVDGREGPDELVGGDGVDTIEGGGGTDGCEGEAVSGCERPARLGRAASTPPAVARDAADPGRLQLTIPTLAGEFEYIYVDSSGASARLRPDPDRAPPPTAWNVTAPDCSQDSATKIVTCTAPVTSLLVVGGDGDDGVEAGHVTFPVLGSAGAGADYLGGGLADDLLDGGPGPDLVSGGPGADRLVGGLDDDDVFGGSGGDRLVGSEGRDRMLGEGNVDRVSARDGAADGAIDCGPGSDRKEKAKLDPVDPKARSC